MVEREDNMQLNIVRFSLSSTENLRERVIKTRKNKELDEEKDHNGKESCYFFKYAKEWKLNTGKRNGWKKEENKE
jgi:hypothetical protein